MYFGSVRFFRHLIITVVIIFFLLPIFLAVFFGIKCSVIKRELREINQVVTNFDIVEHEELKNELQKLNESLAGQLDDIQSELEKAINKQTPVIEQSFDQSLNSSLADFQEESIVCITEKLDMLQQKFDDSMVVQAAILQSGMSSSEQAAEIEQQLNGLLESHESIESYMEYISSYVGKYISQSDGNP
mgnify:CR=1 FL=1